MAAAGLAGLMLVGLLALALALEVRRLRGQVAALRERLAVPMAAVSGSVAGSGPGAGSASGRSGPVIEIRILNPFELAAREARAAAAAAKLAPRLIERIVYSRAAGQIDTQLKAEGVDAQVSVHGI